MTSQLWNFIELIFPFIAGLFFLIQAFLVRKKNSGTTSMSFLGLFSFDIPYSHQYILRYLLLVVASLCFCWPAFKDYSKFYPSYYSMNVFFDTPGVKASLNDLEPHKHTGLQIVKDWEEHKKNYLIDLSTKISQKLHIQNFFQQPNSVESSGGTTFVVEKMKVGWQHYKITQANGELVHYLCLPNKKNVSFSSKFVLKDSRYNIVKARLVDIYINWSVLLMPKFKQEALISANSEPFYDHDLFAVTKVTFFPVLKVSNSVYFVQMNNGEQVFPVGYAVYTPVANQ